MYFKKIIIASSLLLTTNLYANNCSIDLVSQIGNQYEYEVNGSNVTVEHLDGIANLLIAKDQSTGQTYRGIVKENSVCLNLSQNCVDIYSNDIKEYIPLFLEGNFCAGEEK